MSVFTSFNRSYMALVHAEVHGRFPKVRPMRDAWVHRTGFGGWEFHGPGRFYDHFQAEDAYHARSKGWESWLRKQDRAAAPGHGHGQSPRHRVPCGVTP